MRQKVSAVRLPGGAQVINLYPRAINDRAGHALNSFAAFYFTLDALGVQLLVS